MKYGILTLLILSIVFVPFSNVIATNDPGITPDSFWYGFKTAFEKVNLFLTFSSEKKAEKALKYAEKRLAEVEETAEKDPKAAEKAIVDYEKKINLATESSKKIKDENRAETLFNLIAENTQKHQETLAGVLEKVPDESKEAILKAIEISRRGQEEATQQIHELKGEIELLKKEIEALKQDKENQQAEEKEVKKAEAIAAEAKRRADLEAVAKAKTEAEQAAERAEKAKIEAEVTKAAADTKAAVDAKLKAEQEAQAALAKQKQEKFNAFFNEFATIYKSVQDSESYLEKVSGYIVSWNDTAAQSAVSQAQAILQDSKNRAQNLIAYRTPDEYKFVVRDLSGCIDDYLKMNDHLKESITYSIYLDNPALEYNMEKSAQYSKQANSCMSKVYSWLTNPKTN